MEAGLRAAQEQYRLVMAEHELLEKTLAGSVKVLIAKLHAKQPLSEVERRMIDHTPEAAHKVIAHIPRLAGVAKVVSLQNRGFDGSGFPEDGPKGTDIPLDARILKILTELSNVATGLSPSRSDFDVLALRAGHFDPSLFERVRAVLEVGTDLAHGQRPAKKLATGLLLPDMVLAADVSTADGRLVLSAPVQLSETHIESLRNLARLKRIPDAVAVFADDGGA